MKSELRLKLEVMAIKALESRLGKDEWRPVKEMNEMFELLNHVEGDADVN